MRTLFVSAWILSTLVAASAFPQQFTDIQQYDPVTGAPNSPYLGQSVTVWGRVYVLEGTFDNGARYLSGRNSGQYTSDGGIRIDLAAATVPDENTLIGATGTVAYKDGEIVVTDVTIDENFGAWGLLPDPIPIDSLQSNFELVGSYVSALGKVDDLTSDSFYLKDGGQQLLVSIDGSTGISLALVARGERYRVRGALTMYQGELRLKPRRQADLVENPTTIRVQTDGTDSFATVAMAMDAAAPGDTIAIASGTYHEYRLPLKGGVVVRSETGDPEDVVIDAQQQGGLLVFDDIWGPDWFALEGLTLTGGANDNFGVLTTWFDAKRKRNPAATENLNPLSIKDCIIRDNQALSTLGSIIHGYDHVRPMEIDNCVFMNNNATHSLVWLEYGFGSLRFDGCTFVRNTSETNGLVAYPSDSLDPPEFVNTLVAFNLTSVYDANEDDSPFFSCSNIYGNSQGDWVAGLAAQAGLNGNVSANPLFCDLAGGDLTLADNSPCLPGNHPDGEACGGIGARALGACGATDNQADQLMVSALGHMNLRPGESVPIELNLFDADGRRVMDQGQIPSLLASPNQGTISPLILQPDSTWTAVYTAGPSEGPDTLAAFDPESVTTPGDTLGLMVTNAAIISSVKDVPDDNGGQVQIDWRADARDTLGSADPIVQYVVWRRVLEDATNPDRPAVHMAVAVDSWHKLGGESALLVDAFDALWERVSEAVPGVMGLDYSATVPTHADSTAAGLRTSVFFVSAHTADPQVFFTSPPDSGYSVDNMAPDVQMNVAATAFPPGDLPDPTVLQDAVPNPFNPSTTLSFHLAAAGPVRLAIYDVAGRLVRSLLDESRNAGRHEVIWDGRDTARRMSAAGVYLYRLETKELRETKRIVLVR